MEKCQEIVFHNAQLSTAGAHSKRGRHRLVFGVRKINSKMRCAIKRESPRSKINFGPHFSPSPITNPISHIKNIPHFSPSPTKHPIPHIKETMASNGTDSQHLHDVNEPYLLLAGPGFQPARETDTFDVSTYNEIPIPSSTIGRQQQQAQCVGGYQHTGYKAVLLR